MTNRYHVKTGQGRTTVSLDKFLSSLLAVQQGADPGSHEAVRLWLQQQVDADPGAFGFGRTSQRLQDLALRQVAQPELIRLVEDAQVG